MLALYRNALGRLILLAVSISLVESAQAQIRDTAVACGATEKGIALCLYTSVRSDILTVELKNRGSADAVLNLGFMFGNGRNQYASAIALEFKDESGKIYRGIPAHPPGAGIGGRLEPLIVPLPAGASIKLPLYIGDCGLNTDGKFERFGPDPKKSYSVIAIFSGKPIANANPSVDYSSLPLWVGTASSNSVPLDANDQSSK